MNARRGCARPGAIVLAASCVAMTPLPSRAQAALGGARPTGTSAAVALRIAGRAAIRVDGLADELAWRAAPAVRELTQQEPDEGAPASEETEIRIIHDSTTLYVAVLAHDHEPDRVIARILRRDRIMEDDGEGRLRFAGDDAVALLFDSFHDRRNAIVLATNANGAEFDAQVADEGREINVSWRGVWTAAAARVAEGWSAEFAIPLRTLRSSSDGSWGFNVYRVIRRRNEHVLWRSWRREREGFLRVSRAGELRGMAPGRADGARVDVKPYALIGATGTSSAGGVSAPPGAGEASTRTDLGLDFKYEISRGVVLDATLNADFAQAEVDDEQVNLTRFDLFLPEKREFFLENSGIFEFGARGAAEPPPFLLFFSRRIGISDSGAVPLLGGARLSGRAGAQTVGLLHAVTGRAFGLPREQHTVARVKRDAGGSGYVGAMITRRAGAGESSGAGGVDWSLWPTRTLNVQGFVARTTSSTAGGEGLAYRLGVGIQRDRVGFTGFHMGIDPDVRPAHGFVTRADIRRTHGLLRLTARPVGLRRVDLMVLGEYASRVNGEFQDWVAGPALSITAGSGDNANPYFTAGRTRVDEPFRLARRAPVAARDYAASDLGLILTTSSARRVSATLHLAHQQRFDGRIGTAIISARGALAARLALEAAATRSEVSLPSTAFTADVASARAIYAFSTHLSASVRAQYNALERRLTTSARLEYLYRPGSDLLVVVEDARSRSAATEMPDVPDRRGAVVKLTWLSRL